MPTSAINAGYATHILPVEQMPAMLLEVARQSTLRLHVPPIAPEKLQSGINQILLQLRSATGHNFSLCKKSTIGRRIQRRRRSTPSKTKRYMRASSRATRPKRNCCSGNC